MRYAKHLAVALAYVKSVGPIGYVLYAFGYGLIGLVFPGSVLTIGAGAIFGIVGGTIVVLTGATLTATIAFILARTVLRKRIERITTKNTKFQAVDQAIAREGIKIVVLVRLAAVFPFTIVNYAFGLTGIRLGPYIAATAVGILPGTIAFVYLGAAAASIATQHHTKLIITIAGLVIAFAVSIFVARVAHKAIQRAGVDAS
ncbi:MAG TPA: TVP38/TMEM64 family protein [Thermoanaerobaculia bacterium]